jgi:hypothetical protein
VIVHTADDQCTVGDDGRCSGCGATHAAPCPGCGATAYGRPGCERCSPPPPLAIMVVEVEPGRLEVTAEVPADLVAAVYQCPTCGDNGYILGGVGNAPDEQAEDPCPDCAPGGRYHRAATTNPASAAIYGAVPRRPITELETAAARAAGVPGADRYPTRILGMFTLDGRGRVEPAAEPYAGPFYFADENAGAAASAKRVEAEVVAPPVVGADLGDQPAIAAVLAIDLTDPRVWPVLDPARGVATSVTRAELRELPREVIADLLAGVPVPLERRGDRLEIAPAFTAARPCHCGYPALRPIHTGGKDCSRSEPTAIEPVVGEVDWSSLMEPTGYTIESRRVMDAAELVDLATVHGFGHPDVTLTSQITVSSPPVEPGKAGAYVDLRVYVRPRDLGRGRIIAAHLHELAAAVYRATPATGWPVAIVTAGDCALPSGYVGRIAVELENASERGPALEAIRAMHELGSRPW